MKTLRNLLLLAGFTASLPYGLAAQTPSSPRVVTVAPDKERERGFIYNVKVIDEFIERFNDDKNSYLRQVYKSKKQPFNFNRRKLIQSLFNNPKNWTAKPEVKRFIAQVADSTHPQRLAITDSNWYANVNCLFSTANGDVTIPLVLQMIVSKDSGATWMITGVGESPALEGQKVKAGRTKEEAVNVKKSISPADYATNFLALHRVLVPAMNPANYFMPALLRTEHGTAFVQLVKAGKLKFLHTENPQFYFFQIPDYIFTVERFERPGINSGWLINSLKPATDAQKAQQKVQLLQRPL